jgi:hypothetical protein
MNERTAMIRRWFRARFGSIRERPEDYQAWKRSFERFTAITEMDDKSREMWMQINQDKDAAGRDTTPIRHVTVKSASNSANGNACPGSPPECVHFNDAKIGRRTQRGN